MKEYFSRFSWSDVVKFVISLLVSGIAFVAENEATIIVWVVMVAVWIINTLFKLRGIQIGRKWLTGILFGLAIVLSLAFDPVALPQFPAWYGDISLYADSLSLYITALVSVGTGIVAGATGLYNMLLKDVLGKLLYTPEFKLGG